MLRSTLLIVGSLIASGAVAGPLPEQGKSLHEQHCVACHTRLGGGDPGALYSRPDRRVDSRAALERQVRACRDNLGLRLFDEEVAALAHYLDRTWYRFEE